MTQGSVCKSIILTVSALMAACGGVEQNNSVSSDQTDADLSQGTELLTNGSLNKRSGSSFVGWKPFESGYKVSTKTYHSSSASVQLKSWGEDVYGIYQSVALNQTTARALEISGWSRAQSVTGSPDTYYAIYTDVQFQDGTSSFNELGRIEFATGTHDWTKQSVVINPGKPVKTITVYAAFGNTHTGTVWFDDISLKQIQGSNSADAGSSNPTADAGTVDAGNPSPVPEDGGSSGTSVTVTPSAIDDVLTNPGMGFTAFHGSNPSTSQQPSSTVSYWRWTWAQLEPEEGKYNFDLVDSAIQSAKALGQQLAFRIMPCWKEEGWSESMGSVPQWLLKKGVKSVQALDGVFPDHNDPIFLQYHAKLVAAFGSRYAGSADVDHVDIGSVGCWGEWNTACCDSSTEATCKKYFPNEQSQRTIIDTYFDAFPGTPLVALITDLTSETSSYAEYRGAGWRGDCFGDYGFFDAEWNHMSTTYAAAAKDSIVGAAWKTAPVQFESCGVMQDWLEHGFDIDLILQKGLDWHMSVLNNKSSPVPQQWRSKVDEWLKRVGYRLVLTSLTHSSKATPGQSLSLASTWENRGVAPVYHPWPLAWRLRSSNGAIVAQWKSAADLRTWLPGQHTASDVVTLPSGIASGVYSLDVAVMTEDAKQPFVQLAIAGKRSDKWYQVSQVTVQQ